MVCVAIVDFERRAEDRAVGVQLDHEARVDPARHFPPSLERGNQRTRREPADRDRSATLFHAVTNGRTVAVGVAGVARIFETQQIAVTLVPAAIDDRDRAIRLERDLHEPILERTSADVHVFGPSQRHRRARAQGHQAQRRDGRSAKRDAHLVHFVLVGRMAGRVDPLLRHAARQDLHGNGAAIGERAMQREGPEPRSFAVPAII